MSGATPLVLGIAALLALPSGCNDDDDDSGPSDQQVLLVQRATAASGAAGQVVEASNAEILASGSASPGSPPAFNFSASIDVVLDLDATDLNGNDRFPNASGQIHVTASGTVTGTSLLGDAAYSVAVAAQTDVLATNPDTGAIVLIPAGSTWSYQLDVAWSVTDSNTWTVTATAAAQVAVSDMTVIDGASVQTVDVQGQREVVATLARTAGTLTFQRSVEGSLTITVNDGITEETLAFVFENVGRVTISVQGEVFGPMTEAQARALFQASIT